MSVAPEGEPGRPLPVGSIGGLGGRPNSNLPWIFITVSGSGTYHEDETEGGVCMTAMRRGQLVGWLVLMAASAAPGAAAQGAPRPPGVTDSTIAWGWRLFHGSANCAACHGEDGQGTRDGPALTGALWLHGPGTYQWLIEQIKLGIPAHEAWTRKPMPMRGWTNMPDGDVRAVAAYVWSITHPPREIKPKPHPS
jgi:mono/diheme cytochrome c family protein